MRMSAVYGQQSLWNTKQKWLFDLAKLYARIMKLFSLLILSVSNFEFRIWKFTPTSFPRLGP